jgi:hypothetical protein
VDAILIGVRIPPAGVAELDAWIKKHAPDMSRPEAIRRLVEIGLRAKGNERIGRRDSARAVDSFFVVSTPPEPPDRRHISDRL